MAKYDEKYGKYYGELICPTKLEEGYKYEFSDRDIDVLKDIYNPLTELKVVDILLDIKEDQTWFDTLYFTITEETDMKRLLLLVVYMRFDEFDEISENTFRCWVD